MNLLRFSCAARVLIAILIVTLTGLSLASAAETKTYTILPNQDRLFQFRGGLLGFGFSSRLQGSFDVTTENGISQISRFDVKISDPLDQGSFNTGWKDGDPLVKVLFLNPIGISGSIDGNRLLMRSPILEPDPPFIPVLDQPGQFVPALPHDFAYTVIELTDLGGPTARVTIGSGPKSWEDNPIFITPNLGFLVQATPEPGALSLTLAGIATLGLCHRALHD
jgi:hypothetical protein